MTRVESKFNLLDVPKQLRTGVMKHHVAVYEEEVCFW